MKKNTLINVLVILAVIIIAAIILLSGSNTPKTDEETAKCIGENSVLYIQLGCHFCEQQLDMFGEYKKHLNIVDCFYERDNPKCSEIQGTPTWEINNKLTSGLKTIDYLKNETGC